MSDMTKKISGWALGALVVAVMTPMTLAHADTGDDLDFYQHLLAHGINLGSESHVIQMAQTLCQDLNSGYSQKDMVDLMTGAGLTQEQAARFIGAATGEYCPDKHPSTKPSGS